MTWLKFNNLDNFNTFEKKYCYNGIKWTCQNRFGSDGYIKNVTTGEKKLIEELTEEEHNTADYPLFGRKVGKLNTVNGFTTAIHGIRESIDGFYYAKKMSDKVIPELRDEENNIIRPSLTIPYLSSFYSGCVADGETEIEPEWVEIEE